MSEENKNTEEQFIDDGSSLIEERSNENIAASEQPETQNSQTSDMEVHKHPHHITHKKKWGEYLLEFLMLFLAVFLGFVAENMREHVVEQDRAKEFSRSLVQDLQNDTAAVTRQKKSATLYISMADTLLALSKSSLEGSNAAKFSFYTRFTYWTAPISWNRATFEQIKNSGSLRYFKNAGLLKKLLEYDALVHDINGEANANAERGFILLPLINSVIDPTLNHDLSKYYLVTLDSMSSETRESFFSVETGSFESKRDKIDQLLNMVIVQQRNLQLQINTKWTEAQALAKEMINDLKQEYHLE